MHLYQTKNTCKFIQPLLVDNTSSDIKQRFAYDFALQCGYLSVTCEQNNAYLAFFSIWPATLLQYSPNFNA